MTVIELKVAAKNSLGIPVSGISPSLKVDDSGVSYTCSSTNLFGESTCLVKSIHVGTFEVQSMVPSITDRLVLQFTDVKSTFSSDNPGNGIINQLTSVTDPQSYALVYAVLLDQNGNALIGQIPILEIQGSGINSYRCYPSNSNGIAYCQINSTEGGSKTVRMVQPPALPRVTFNVISNIRTCISSHSTTTEQRWVGPDIATWGICTALTCETNYSLSNNVCVAKVRSCDPMPLGGLTGTQTWDSRSEDKTWGFCTIDSCLVNYTRSGSGPGNSCAADTRNCLIGDLVVNSLSGFQTWNGTDWGVCNATSCSYPYKPSAGVCVMADVTPTLSGLLINQTNAIPNQTYTSSTLVVSDLERNIPVTLSGGNSAYIETRRTSGSWVNRGTEIAAATLTDPQSGLVNGDEIRIVSNSASTLVTTSTLTLSFGSASSVLWSITTSNTLPPSNPVLSHAVNMKSFTVSWGSGGLGNGGANGCKLQYFKDNSVWTDLSGTYNCDTAQGVVSMNLPGDNWTNNFVSPGVTVRLVRVSDEGEIITFADKLTCIVDSAMPFTNNVNKDEDCNGKWADEDDHLAPTGGNFLISAIDNGDSTTTGTTSVNLTISCPSDQAGGIEVAFGNSASPTSWGTCTITKAHTLTAGGGTKTVYMRFRDAYGNTSADLTNSILLDQSAPTGGSLTINSGATRTSLTAVTLNITCPTDASGAVEMAYGSTSSPTNWESCISSKPYILSTGDGSKTAYLRFKDKFGNTSSDLTSGITLDQTGPVSSLSYASGWVNSSSFALTASASDAQNSTPLVCSIEAQAANLSGTTVGAYGGFSEVSNSCTNTNINVTHGKAYRLRMKSTDSLGNLGSFYDPNIEFKVDNLAPSISIVSATTSGSQPACEVVRVAINGANDSEAGLMPSAYSFDGGSSWQASNSKDFATTSLNLFGGSIRVRDNANNVFSYGSSVNGSASSCSCNLPWGGVLGDGQSVTAYSIASATSPTICSSYSQTRTCSSGVLGGNTSYQYQCTQSYRSCSLPGYGTLAHGQQVLSYDSSSVACGGSCSQNYISCNDGTLSGGSTYYGSCSVSACASCPAGVGNWGSSSQCQGDFPTTASGSSYSASNSTLGHSGSATASCYNGTWTTGAYSCSDYSLADGAYFRGGTVRVNPSDGTLARTYATGGSWASSGTFGALPAGACTWGSYQYTGHTAGESYASYSGSCYRCSMGAWSVTANSNCTQ